MSHPIIPLSDPNQSVRVDIELPYTALGGGRSGRLSQQMNVISCKKRVRHPNQNSSMPKQLCVIPGRLGLV